MDHLMFIVVCLIWGSSFIIMREASAAFGPITIAATRVLGAAAALGVIIWLRREKWTLRTRDLPAMMIVVACGYLLPFILQPLLIGKHHNSGFFGMMVSLVPLLTIAISAPMLRIWPTPRQVIGVAGGLACLVILAYEGRSLAIGLGDFALACLVPLGYAMSNTFVKKRFSSISPIVLVCAVTAVASLIVTPLGLAREPIQTANPSVLTITIIELAFLGVVGTGLATWMFYTLIQRRGPLYAGMVTYLVPIGALLWGWVGDEKITAGQVAALVGVFAMVALVQAPANQPSITPIDADEVDDDDAGDDGPQRDHLDNRQPARPQQSETM